MACSQDITSKTTEESKIIELVSMQEPKRDDQLFLKQGLEHLEALYKLLLSKSSSESEKTPGLEECVEQLFEGTPESLSERFSAMDAVIAKHAKTDPKAAEMAKAKLQGIIENKIKADPKANELFVKALPVILNASHPECVEQIKEAMTDGVSALSHPEEIASAASEMNKSLHPETENKIIDQFIPQLEKLKKENPEKYNTIVKKLLPMISMITLRNADKAGAVAKKLVPLLTAMEKLSNEQIGKVMQGLQNLLVELSDPAENMDLNKAEKVIAGLIDQCSTTSSTEKSNLKNAANGLVSAYQKSGTPHSPSFATIMGELLLAVQNSEVSLLKLTGKKNDINLQIGEILKEVALDNLNKAKKQNEKIKAERAKAKRLGPWMVFAKIAIAVVGAVIAFATGGAMAGLIAVGIGAMMASGVMDKGEKALAAKIGGPAAKAIFMIATIVASGGAAAADGIMEGGAELALSELSPALQTVVRETVTEAVGEGASKVVQDAALLAAAQAAKQTVASAGKNVAKDVLEEAVKTAAKTAAKAAAKEAAKDGGAAAARQAAKVIAKNTAKFSATMGIGSLASSGVIMDILEKIPAVKKNQTLMLVLNALIQLVMVVAAAKCGASMLRSSNSALAGKTWFGTFQKGIIATDVGVTLGGAGISATQGAYALEQSHIESVQAELTQQNAYIQGDQELEKVVREKNQEDGNGAESLDKVLQELRQAMVMPYAAAQAATARHM